MSRDPFRVFERTLEIWYLHGTFYGVGPGLLPGTPHTGHGQGWGVPCNPTEGRGATSPEFQILFPSDGRPDRDIRDAVTVVPPTGANILYSFVSHEASEKSFSPWGPTTSRS